MSSARTASIALLVAVLVAVAGCTGLSGGADETTAPNGTTTAPTTHLTTAPTTGGTTVDSTDPHTAEGTSHTGTHLVVRDSTSGGNVSVTLVGADNATYEVTNHEIDLTREIHDRGHGVRAVVERGDETVFDQVVRGYEYYEVTVHENATDVSYSVV